MFPAGSVPGMLEITPAIIESRRVGGWVKFLRSFAGVRVQSSAGHVHADDSADGIWDEAGVRFRAFLPISTCFCQVLPVFACFCLFWQNEGRFSGIHRSLFLGTRRFVFDGKPPQLKSEELKKRFE